MTIVVALIGVLMAFSLPMLTQANEQARSTVCRQNLADIGEAVSAYATDQQHMPTVVQMPPHHEGLSLPELLHSRLHTPNALMCPSDETEDSQLLGTSYRWSPGFNGIAVAELERMRGRPLLSDREAYHASAELPSNELVIQRHGNRYQFVVTGHDAQPQSSDHPSQPPERLDPEEESDNEDDSGRGHGRDRNRDRGRDWERGRRYRDRDLDEG